MQMPSMFYNFCKPSILVCFSKPLPDPWLLVFIYRLDLAELAESCSTLAKMLIETNFHCLQKILCIKWNVLPLCTLSLPMGSCIYPQTGSGGGKILPKMPISPIFSRYENSYESNVLV